MTIFTLGMAVTALCGAFLVLIPSILYDGMRLTLVALIIVVLGGVGSAARCAGGWSAAGHRRGCNGFLAWACLTQVVFLALLFLMLMLRPEGLLESETDALWPVPYPSCCWPGCRRC